MATFTLRSRVRSRSHSHLRKRNAASSQCDRRCTSNLQLESCSNNFSNVAETIDQQSVFIHAELQGRRFDVWPNPIAWCILQMGFRSIDDRHSRSSSTLVLCARSLLRCSRWNFRHCWSRNSQMHINYLPNAACVLAGCVATRDASKFPHKHFLKNQPHVQT